ncbi:hypothetical protein HDV63DRAFT_138204 [Trichoderma sp. SZMC 28014]
MSLSVGNTCACFQDASIGTFAHADRSNPCETANRIKLHRNSAQLSPSFLFLFFFLPSLQVRIAFATRLAKIRYCTISRSRSAVQIIGGKATFFVFVEGHSLTARQNFCPPTLYKISPAARSFDLLFLFFFTSTILQYVPPLPAAICFQTLCLTFLSFTGESFL